MNESGVYYDKLDKIDFLQINQNLINQMKSNIRIK